jgi:hypothetical protein
MNTFAHRRKQRMYSNISTGATIQQPQRLGDVECWRDASRSCDESFHIAAFASKLLCSEAGLSINVSVLSVRWRAYFQKYFGNSLLTLQIPNIWNGL